MADYGADMTDWHPAVERLLRDPANAAAFDQLVTQLSGSDATSLLLAIAQARAGSETSSQVLRRYSEDRFVAPSPVDGLAMSQVEHDALRAVSAGYLPVALAPLAPFGAHHVLGQTPQNNVVTTTRLSEVAADPTNVLALEAATRRKVQLGNGEVSGEVRLAAAQRITRAQKFEGPRSFAHFAALGLVHAGRDRGDFRFELEAIETMLESLTAAVRAATSASMVVRLTAFNPALREPCDRLATRLTQPDVEVVQWPERTHGEGYYRNVCFKLDVELNDERFEIGDGGDVWWLQDLLQSRKERLVIGGLGLERLAMLVAES